MRDVSAPFRMPITTVHKIRGVGTVIAGRIISGALHVGDEVVVVPSGATAKVKSIEMFKHTCAQGSAGYATHTHPNTERHL